jgi:hypothetical protein
MTLCDAKCARTQRGGFCVRFRLHFQDSKDIDGGDLDAEHDIEEAIFGEECAQLLYEL